MGQNGQNARRIQSESVKSECFWIRNQLLNGAKWLEGPYDPENKGWIRMSLNRNLIVKWGKRAILHLSFQSVFSYHVMKSSVSRSSHLKNDPTCLLFQIVTEIRLKVVMSLLILTHYLFERIQTEKKLSSPFTWIWLDGLNNTSLYKSCAHRIPSVSIIS